MSSSPKRIYTPNFIRYKTLTSNRYITLTPINKLGGGSFGVVYRALGETKSKHGDEYAIKFEGIPKPDSPPWAILSELRTIYVANKLRSLRNYAAISKRVILPRSLYEKHALLFQNYKKFIGIIDAPIPIRERKGTRFIDSVLYIQPFIKGTTMDGFIRNHANVSYDVKLKMMADLLHGLSMFSAEHIVLSDIKPPNIMIEAGTNRPYFIDFSGSCWLKWCEVTGAHTTTYDSPDQFKENTHTMHQYTKADVYALGVSFLELLTGKVLFNSTESKNSFPKKSYDAIRKKAYLRIDTLLKNYPENLQVFIKSMIEPDYIHRTTALRALHHLQDIISSRKKTTKRTSSV